MRKRLIAIEDRLSPDESKSGVVFFPLKGETDQEYDDRVARWYAGEMVVGQDRLYTGKEVVGRIRFVPSS
jgi:hypothetical protein